MGKIKWSDKIKVFGLTKTIREFFWNGIVFMLMGVVYRVFAITSKIPVKISEMSQEEFDALTIELSFLEEIIPLLLFWISYWILNKSLFPNVLETIKNRGALIALRNSILLVFAILIVTTFLQIFGTFLIAY